MTETDYIDVAIVPDRMIYLGELYDISPSNEECRKEFLIKKIIIYKTHGMLDKIVLDCGFHPNCKSDTKEFCISPYLIGIEVDNILLSIIRSTISVYNMDKAYQRPWGKITYEKCNTMKWRIKE